MALGWHVRRADGTRWHNGQTGGGYHAVVGVRPDRSAGVVAMTNTGHGRVDAATLAILRLLAAGRAAPRGCRRASPSGRLRPSGTPAVT